MVKGSGTYHKPDKAALAEWNTSHEIVKLLLVSLGKCHSQAVASAKILFQSLCPETVVDGKYGYRHGQLVQAHLDLLQLLLKEADLYLPWNRCKEMWDTLVTNTDACEADREVNISNILTNDIVILNLKLFVMKVLFSMVCILFGGHATRNAKFAFS